ncbi:MAG TPA: HAD family hydrolase [Roseateles sp.]
MNLTLFDLDGTLIPVDSDHSFGAFMVEVGWADAVAWGAKNDEFFAQYNAGTLDLPAYVAFATSAWRNRPLAEALAMRERFMAEIGQPALRPEAIALVEKHRAAGDLIALVTATNEFVTAPFAEAFGIEHLIAVQLERDEEGRYTGAVRGVPSFREGKIARVESWLQGLGAQWSGFKRVTFYSDSTNDLPLLERVSHPVATNPSPTLSVIAAERGWPQLQLFA